MHEISCIIDRYYYTVCFDLLLYTGRILKIVNQNYMKEKEIGPLLLTMALPMVLSMMVNSLYNIIDSYFVAKISEDSMTSLSLVFPVQNLCHSVAVGFGVGINADIAISLGAGRRERANCSATVGLILSVIHGFILMILSIGIMPWFLKLFTQNGQVIRYGIQYSQVVFLFAIVSNAGIAFEKIFQSVGNMKVTMISMSCGCVANIILDPILIFGYGIIPKMGIRGAALATGIGQVLTLMIYMMLYVMKPLSVSISKHHFKRDSDVIKKLYYVGIPATLNMALSSVLIVVLNTILAAISQSYVLVLGIYYKLQTFLYLPANGIIQGMRPLIGFNYGAGEKERVKEIYRIVFMMCAGIMLIGMVVCLVIPGELMGLFASTKATVAIGEKALRIICLGFVISAVSVTVSGAFEGIGKGMPSLIISLCRYVIIMIPVAIILSRFFGDMGVWVAFPITEVLSAGISLYEKRTNF